MNEIEKAIIELNETFSGIRAVHNSEFRAGDEAGIWFRGSEDGITGSDGNRLINYYSYDSDPKERIWVRGVHKELIAILAKHGLYGQFNDPGTLMAFQ